MPKQIEENSSIDAEDDDFDFDDEDFGFIIGKDGDLKHLMIPENLMDDPPPQIKKILKIFGIKDIHLFEDRILH